MPLVDNRRNSFIGPPLGACVPAAAAAGKAYSAPVPEGKGNGAAGVFTARLGPHSGGLATTEGKMADGGHSALYEKGLAMRRAVLGADYVDRSLKSADTF